MQRLERAEPHLVLAIAVAVVLALEAGYARHTSDAWIVVEALVAGAALIYAWRVQDRLRLGPLLALAFAFNAGWVAVHLGLHVRGDFDSRHVYRVQGESLLHGNYPRSEYPPGAVLLFAFEAAMSGGATRVANAIVMIPFQLLTVMCVWALRTRYSSWLAAAIAVWPLNAFFWEFKFDLVPASLLALGLLLALRERWALSGLALGLGAAVKWTPGFAAAALAVWLGCSGRLRLARDHLATFLAALILVYLPFLVWSPHEVWAAYSRQSGRRITPESVWYLPLHWAGLAHVRSHISFSAGAPRWADVLAIVVQGLLVLGVLGATAIVRRRLRSGVALAAIAPVAFLAPNRIFSPQYMVLFVTAWVIAASLLAGDRREQLAIGVAVGVTTFANVFVYPFALPHYVVTWQVCSFVLFVLSFAVSVAIVGRALSPSPSLESGAA